MSSNCRFTLDERRYVIDAVNADNLLRAHREQVMGRGGSAMNGDNGQR